MKFDAYIFINRYYDPPLFSVEDPKEKFATESFLSSAKYWQGDPNGEHYGAVLTNKGLIFKAKVINGKFVEI